LLVLVASLIDMRVANVPGEFGLNQQAIVSGAAVTGVEVTLNSLELADAKLRAIKSP
jgi:hypothetical protein